MWDQGGTVVATWMWSKAWSSAFGATSCSTISSAGEHRSTSSHRGKRSQGGNHAFCPGPSESSCGRDFTDQGVDLGIGRSEQGLLDDIWNDQIAISCEAPKVIIAQAPHGHSVHRAHDEANWIRLSLGPDRAHAGVQDTALECAGSSTMHPNCR